MHFILNKAVGERSRRKLQKLDFLRGKIGLVQRFEYVYRIYRSARDHRGGKACEIAEIVAGHRAAVLRLLKLFKRHKIAEFKKAVALC